MKTSVHWGPFFVLLVLLAGCDSGPMDDSPAPRWSQSGLNGLHVRELTVQRHVLYAATDSGLYRRSLDPGADWRTDGLQGKRVVDVTWRGDGAMLAGVRYEGGAKGTVLYKRAATSSAQWTPFDASYGPEDRRTVRALTSIPGARDTLLARGAINVVRSVNGGKDWESVWSDWDQIGYQAPLLYVSPHDPSLVFAGGENAAFQPYLVRSLDYGATWQSTSGISGGGDNAVYSMIEHPDEPGRFLLGMEGRVLHSDDGGQHWTLQYRPPSYTYIFDFAARSEGNRTIVYAAGSENGTQGGSLTLHRSTDFGERWERIVYEDGPESAAIRALSFVDEGRERLFLGTTEGVYVYRP